MTQATTHHPSARPLVLGFVALAVVIAVAAYFVWRQQAHSIQQQADRTLTAVAKLKAGQIASWLDERRGNAEMVRADPLVSSATADLLAGRRAASASADLQTLLDAFRQTYGYVDVLMTTPGGTVLLRAPRAATPALDPRTADLVAKATTTGSVQSSDLYLDAAGRVRLDFVAPILRPGGATPAIAALTLRTDPASFLFPLIQTWPVASRSGETLLVEKSGSRVLYLNELRFRKGTALRLAVPANALDLPAAMAVRGRRGVVQGIDYRSIPVLAALQGVTGTPWYIVAKEDSNDVLGPIAVRAWTLAAIALVLVTLAGAGTLLLWRLRESQVSAEIRESEEKFRSFFELSADLVCIADIDGRFRRVNPAWSKTLGYSDDELVAKPFLDFVHPDDVEETKRVIAEELARGETVISFENRYLRKDGGVVWLDWTSQPEVTEGTTFAIARDVTERKRAEASLRENEQRLRFLVDQTPTVNWTLDRDLRFTLSRGHGLQALGLEPDQVLGMYVGDYLGGPGPQGDLGVAMHARALAGDSFIYEQQVGDLTFDIILGPLRGADGENLGVIGVGYNATERKLADEARRGAEEQLRRLNVELEQRVVDRTAQLDAANKELEAFAYSVSHDLRAPLRHISGFSALLAERVGDDLDEKSRHYVDTISRSVREMGVLIDDLLQFSRTGRAELQIADVDMEAALREALEPLQHESADRAIEWSIGPLPHAVGDHALLRQVWANLLGNAAKYTRGQTPARIEVGARDDGHDEAVFWVRDNGVGFDMAYVRKLFGVFQRLHDSSEFEGTGIGLANVQRIVNRLGGRVWAEGEVGNGATFSFSLPRRKDASS